VGLARQGRYLCGTLLTACLAVAVLSARVLLWPALQHQQVRALFRTIKMGDPRASSKALEDVQRLAGGRGQVASLIQALNDEDPSIRLIAACAISHLGPKAAAAAPVLASGLREKESEWREVCAIALGSIGPAARDAVPLLRQAHNDGNAKVRNAATAALARIDPGAACRDGVSPKLVELLNAKLQANGHP
jgi:HEAT repeat protein